MGMTPTFGHWLRQRRKALGLTQKALAQEAGCAEVTLRKIESGDLQPSAPLVASIAQALGVDERDLPGLMSLARGTGDGLTARTRLLRPQRPNNLPAQLTPLIGREGDITAVRRRLLADDARLVTLVGPPGVGKTRLSLAVAEDVLDQFDDGAFFVRLAPVSVPDQMAAAIAQALGMQMSGPNPPELQLRAYLEEKHLLLVLDNFEQIVAAAPLVDDLLRRCRWLHVLVTSRQPLRVRGERQVAVQPLALPPESPGAAGITADDALRYPAVELFADRAEAVLPDFAVDDGNAAAVAELCRRLDGLPLAIELVAARVKLLPPAELLGRLHGPWLLSTDGLRDVSARQKTLRGAIGWSYDLLSPAEQTLFRYLSIFVGGFTLEAAELLCGDTISPPLPLNLSPAQVLDGIGSLLEKNLLHRETGMYGGLRYEMLETVREYGLEKLASSGEEQLLRRQHACCFLRIINNADKAEINPRKLQLNRLIDDEIHNLRATHIWFMEHDVQAALILTVFMLHWFYMRGPFAEGKRLSEMVLALPGASAPTIARVDALREAGMMMGRNNEPKRALALVKESLELSKELNYTKGEADALLAIGRIPSWGTKVNEIQPRSCFEEALALYQSLGHLGGIAYAQVMLAFQALYQTDYLKARKLAMEALATAQLGGFPFHWPLFVLGQILFYIEGDLKSARSMFEQLLALLQMDKEAGSQIVMCQVSLGEIATRQGEYELARACFYKANTIAKELGNDKFIREFQMYIAELAHAEGDYAQAIKLYRFSLPGVIRDSRNWSYFLLGLAASAWALDHPELTARLLGAINPIDETIQRLFSFERDKYGYLAKEIRSRLDANSFEAAVAQGRQQEFAQIAEEALMILEAALPH